MLGTELSEIVKEPFRKVIVPGAKFVRSREQNSMHPLQCGRQLEPSSVLIEQSEHVSANEGIEARSFGVEVGLSVSNDR